MTDAQGQFSWVQFEVPLRTNDLEGQADGVALASAAVIVVRNITGAAVGVASASGTFSSTIPARGQVSWVQFEVPVIGPGELTGLATGLATTSGSFGSPSRAGVSWVRFEVPRAAPGGDPINTANASIWTQDWHDAQHTGASPTTPLFPLTYIWSGNGPNSPIGADDAHWFDPPRLARPVFSATQMFVPTGQSPRDVYHDHIELDAPYAIYCYTLEDGTNQWHALFGKTSAGAPAYDGTTDRLLVGCTDGYLYALDATSGTPVGSLNTGAPIRTSVTLVGGDVYVTNDAGELHKVAVATMTEDAAFPYTASGSVEAQTSAAYSSSGVVIYCTSDLQVQAVDAVTGAQAWVWTHPLQASMGNDPTGLPIYTWEFSYPVVDDYHGTVWVKCRLDDYNGTGYGLLPPDGGAYGPMTNPTAIRNYLNAHASARPYYVLDLSSGDSTFTPALSWNCIEGNGNFEGYKSPRGYLAQMPVLKHWDNGDTVMYCATQSHEDTYDARHAGNLVEVVLADDEVYSGSVAGDWRYVQARRHGETTIPDTAAGNSYIDINDEEGPITIHGDMVLIQAWSALENVRIVNRPTNHGFSINDPITTTESAVELHSVWAGGVDAATHWFPTGSPQISNYMAPGVGRLWGTAPNGSGPTGAFWAYANILMPPKEPIQDLPGVDMSGTGHRASVGVVTGQFLVSYGPWGWMVFRHSGVVAALNDLHGLASGRTVDTGVLSLLSGSGMAVSGLFGAASVAQDDEFQGAFTISGETATLSGLPYDAAAPGEAAADGAAGIDVIAEFLPPQFDPLDELNWMSFALMQRCFWYQGFDETTHGGIYWAYPNATFGWQVRFAPDRQGVWSWRVKARDGGSGWVTSSASTFTATTPRTHGFPRVGTDPRFFEWSDGSPLFMQGAAAEGDQVAFVSTAAAAGMGVIRLWASSYPLFATGKGYDWSLWNQVYADGLIVCPASGDQPGNLVWTFDRALHNPAGMHYGYAQALCVKEDTTYEFSLTCRTQNVSAGGGVGVTLKFAQDYWTPNVIAELAGATPLTTHYAGNSWSTITGQWTSAHGQWFAQNLFVVLEGTSSGTGLVYEIQMREVLAGDTRGPNLLQQSCADQFRSRSDRGCLALDRVSAAASGTDLLLKIVVLDSGDPGFELIGGGIFGQPATAGNWYIAAIGAYLGARWGGRRNVTWEFINEASPFDHNHFTAAGRWAAAIHQAQARRQLVSTSTQNSFDATAWMDTDGQELDFVDIHAYIGSTWTPAAHEWDPPFATTWDTTNEYITLNPGQGDNSNPQTGKVAVTLGGHTGPWTLSARMRWSGTGNGPSIYTRVDSSAPDFKLPYNDETAGVWDGNWRTYTHQWSFPDTGYYEVSVQLWATYCFTGTAYFDDIVLTSPTGYNCRLFGAGTFSLASRPDLWSDLALQGEVFGGRYGALSGLGVGKPLVRGETGIDYVGGPQYEHTDVALDTAGVCFHTMIFGAGFAVDGFHDIQWNWGGLQSGAYWSYWGHLKDALAGVNLNNGHFQDIAATAGTNKVLGFKDTANGVAACWVRQPTYTWQNKIHNPGAYGKPTGVLSFSGMPNGDYTVTVAQFTSGVVRTTSTQTVTSVLGALSFTLDGLASTTTDAALTFQIATGQVAVNVLQITPTIYGPRMANNISPTSVAGAPAFFAPTLTLVSQSGTLATSLLGPTATVNVPFILGPTYVATARLASGVAYSPFVVVGPTEFATTAASFTPTFYPVGIMGPQEVSVSAMGSGTIYHSPATQPALITVSVTRWDYRGTHFHQPHTHQHGEKERPDEAQIEGKIWPLPFDLGPGQFPEEDHP